jgi:hypothetical protein
VEFFSLSVCFRLKPHRRVPLDYVDNSNIIHTDDAEALRLSKTITNVTPPHHHRVRVVVDFRNSKNGKTSYPTCVRLVYLSYLDGSTHHELVTCPICFVSRCERNGRGSIFQRFYVVIMFSFSKAPSKRIVRRIQHDEITVILKMCRMCAYCNWNGSC